MTSIPSSELTNENEADLTADLEFAFRAVPSEPTCLLYDIKEEPSSVPPKFTEEPGGRMPSSFKYISPTHSADVQTATKSASGSTVVLCDRYLLEELVGIGGTSVVYRARDLRREGD